MIRSALYRLYWQMERVIAPGLADSQEHYQAVLAQRCAGAARWLDLGCGHHVLSPWRHEEEKKLIASAGVVVGLDYDALSLSKHRTIDSLVRADISRLPFADGAFDLVTANMVFEHLQEPQKQLQEIWRVLGRGGRLVFHTPNRAGYPTLLARAVPESLKERMVLLFQGRKEEDVFPAFYRINTAADIRRHARQAGFTTVEVRQVCSQGQFVVVPPLALLELVWIRFLMSGGGRSLRPYLIATLTKDT